MADMLKRLTQIIEVRGEILPNAMHNHQRIACSPVAEFLQKVVEDIVILLHERVGFGRENVREEPRPLEEIDKFVDISGMVKSTYGISGFHNMLE